MTPEQVENLMTGINIKWQKIIARMWAVQDETNKYPQIVLSIEKSEKKDARLLKFLVFICDVPVDVKPDFFKEFLKLNFIVEHGTFAMETLTEMSFMDTLEMKGLDPEEFSATLDAMRKAPRMFRERYDIDKYTF